MGRLLPVGDRKSVPGRRPPYDGAKDLQLIVDRHIIFRNLRHPNILIRAVKRVICRADK